MLPGTLLAGGALLSLVPGWLFLRLTEPVRRPRNQSDLQELLELVAVGLATTGLACLCTALVCPAVIHQLAQPPTATDDIRKFAGAVALLLVIAAILATGAAVVAQKTTKAPTASLGTSVWWHTFRADKVPAGHVPYVAVTLKDGGGVVEGVLEAYTWQAQTDQRRDIALRSPIRYHAGIGTGGRMQYRKPGYDRLVIDGEQVQEIALTYAPK